MKISDFENKIKKMQFGIVSKTVDFINKNAEKIVEINKEQLMEGSNNKGNTLTPDYYSDPYFKTREAAIKYANWKQKITPNKKRKINAPNLFINGRFHNDFGFYKTKLGIGIDAKSSFSTTIKTKYAGQIFGITTENIKKINIDLKTELLQWLTKN